MHTHATASETYQQIHCYHLSGGGTLLTLLHASAGSDMRFKGKNSWKIHYAQPVSYLHAKLDHWLACWLVDCLCTCCLHCRRYNEVTERRMAITSHTHTPTYNIGILTHNHTHQRRHSNTSCRQ